MSQSMSTIYNYFRNLYPKTNTSQQMNLNSFQLISKLPTDPHYNKITFIPTIHKTYDIPQAGKYFNKQIGCADDMVYHTSQEFYSNNLVEYQALGFKDRLKQAMMQSSVNMTAGNAKYIIFTCSTLGLKYNNPIIGVFENTHPNADPNIRLEYEIYNTINNK